MLSWDCFVISLFPRWQVSFNASLSVMKGKHFIKDILNLQTNILFLTYFLVLLLSQHFVLLFVFEAWIYLPQSSATCLESETHTNLVIRNELALISDQQHHIYWWDNCCRVNFPLASHLQSQQQTRLLRQLVVPRAYNELFNSYYCCLSSFCWLMWLFSITAWAVRCGISRN